nr:MULTISPECIES: hypothetical protein [Providencia]
MKHLFSFLFILLLSGCTSVWVPVSGGSQYTQSEARATCKPEAMHLYPVKNEVAQRSVMSSVEKKCKKDDDCGKETTYKEQTPVTESYVLDVNENTRNNYYLECMETKGWLKKDKYMWEWLISL